MNGGDKPTPQGMLNLGGVESPAQGKPVPPDGVPRPTPPTPATTPSSKPRPPRPPRGWKLNAVPPMRAMGQMNWRSWIRLLLQHDVWLTPFEKDVCLTVMRQEFPSAKQRHVLWWALYRIYPIGCGKWGSPGSE